MNKTYCQILSFIILVFIFSSCTVNPEKEIVVPENNSLHIEQDKYSEKSDVFVIESWVQKSNTNDENTKEIWARLIKNGTKVSGTTLHASWPDPSAEGGIRRCDVQSIYNGGVCIIHTEKYESGKYLPIALRFEYAGRIYTSEIGLIP